MEEKDTQKKPVVLYDEHGRLLVSDAGSLGRTLFHYDEAEDTFTLEYEQDVEPILERNVALQNDQDLCWDKERELFHVATVPFVILEFWKNVYGVDWQKKEDEPKLVKLLSDPFWRKLRTGLGGI